MSSVRKLNLWVRKMNMQKAKIKKLPLLVSIFLDSTETVFLFLETLTGSQKCFKKPAIALIHKTKK